MIPVHGSTEELVPDLAMLVIHELEAVERGIRVLARAMPLDEGVAIDALALDSDGKPVLVIIENGVDDLHARAADALLAYRRSRSLLARWFSSEALDESIDPRLMLIAHRFSDRVEARCRLLPGAGTTLVEVAIVQGAAGRQVLLLACGGERVTKRAPNLRLIGRPAEVPVSVAAGLDELESESSAPEIESDPAAQASAAAQPSITAQPGLAAQPGNTAQPVNAAQPGIAAEADVPAERDEGTLWIDELKARILRISPDVLEEQDGAMSRFRFGHQVLVTLATDSDRQVVAVVEGGGGPAQVNDRESCSRVLDNIFERFFNLAAIHRRPVAKSAPFERPHETRLAARMDV